MAKKSKWARLRSEATAQRDPFKLKKVQVTSE